MVSRKKILKPDKSKDNNFVLYGVSCVSDDYKFAWQINNVLGIELIKTEDLKIFFDRIKKESFFSRYHYENDIYKIEFFRNKDSESIKLINLNFDYFIKISPVFEGVDEIKKKLLQVKELIFINELNDNTIKPKIKTEILSFFEI